MQNAQTHTHDPLRVNRTRQKKIVIFLQQFRWGPPHAREDKTRVSASFQTHSVSMQLCPAFQQAKPGKAHDTKPIEEHSRGALSYPFSLHSATHPSLINGLPSELRFFFSSLSFTSLG